MKVIERIFILLDEKGKKAADLARFLNVNTSVTSSWKTRGKNPPVEYITQICEFLDVTTDFLLTGKLAPQQDNSLPIFNKLSNKNKQELQQYAEYLQYKEDKEKVHLHLVAEKNTSYSPSIPKNTIPISEHIKEETGLNINEEDQAPKKELHILGYTAAGEPIDMPDDIYDLGDVIKVPSDSKAEFALEVKGDSMEPDIPNGSLVFIKKQNTVDNGQIAIVSINNTVTCKIFKCKNGIIYLHSINPSYNPIIIDNEDIDFKIIGKVIKK